MKKVIFIVLIAILGCFSLLASTTYEIDTKYGKEKVVIPDGYTEKDVLLEVAKAYYEQNHDMKDIQSQLDSLTETAESYIEENASLRAKYQDLIQDYDVLIKRLEQKAKLGWLKGFVGANYSKQKGYDGVGLSVGALLFNKVLLNSSVSYLTKDSSLLFSLGIGVLF